MILASNISLIIAEPATAGMPPRIAAYQGMFSSILTLRSKFRSNVLSSSEEFLLIWLSLDSFVPVIQTFAPYLFNATAIASPIPPEAPVTSAVLFFRLNINFYIY